MELVVLSGFEEAQNKGNFIERHKSNVKIFWRLAAPYSIHTALCPSLPDHPVPILRVFAVNLDLHVLSTNTGKFVVNSRRDVNVFPGSF